MERNNYQDMKTRPGFYHGHVRALSIAVIVFGVVCLGIGVASLTIALLSECKYRSNYYNGYDDYNDYNYGRIATTQATNIHRCTYYSTFSSPGIWSGLMFLASGIIGVLAAKRKTTCFIVALMVMSIVTTWIALGSLSVAIWSNFDNSWNQINRYPIVLNILNGCLGLLSLSVFILSWIKFGYTCRAVCCNGSKGYPSVKQYQRLTTPHPQMMYAAAPHQMNTGGVPAFPQQPMMQQNNIEPIYLVQRHQVIGMLPQNMQQVPMGNTAPPVAGYSGFAPAQTQQV